MVSVAIWLQYVAIGYSAGSAGSGKSSKLSDVRDVAMDAVSEMSSQAVGRVAGFFTQRKTRRRLDGEASEKQNYTSDDAEPFTEGQSEWLADVVGESIQSSLSQFGMTFGKKIEARVG